MEILKIGIVYDLSICLKIFRKNDIFSNKNSTPNKI